MPDRDRLTIDVWTWPCERRIDGLFFRSLGTVVSGPRASVLLSDFHRATKLHAARIMFDTTSDPVRAIIGSGSVDVETTEQLQILEGVFVDGTYNVQLDRPPLIVDIGMNTAYTALYLAATHPDAVVFAYEPLGHYIPPCAGEHCPNPSLSQQIRGFEIGLSDADRVMNVEYMERRCGSVGYGVPATLRIPSEVN